MRIAFMGTPEFAVPTLEALVEAGHDVAAVYCQPARPAGRGKAPRPSPVQRAAEAHGIAVRTPATLRDAEAQQAFAELTLDVAIVAAYGLILPQPVLDAPAFGCINVHASLLPRWRGAAPIQRAILAGDEWTGITIMQMERGLDTGPMLAVRETAIDGMTAGELTVALARIGAALVPDVLDRLEAIEPMPQPETGITYAAKVDKAEAKLDFSRTAVEAERQVRAFNPLPGAYIEYEGERIKVHKSAISGAAGPPGTLLDDRLTIACAQGALTPLVVQRAGRSAMSAEELLRGFPIPVGTRLS